MSTTGRLSTTGVKLTDRARLVRRAFRRLNQMLRYRRLSLAGVPVLFANSFPKSGTHLLTQALQGFPRLGPAVVSGLPAVVTFEGDSGRARAEEEILSDLRRLLPGDIAYGHLHALPSIVQFLSRPGYATYFILRDPRDVAVSHVHYVTDMEPNHIHHRYYTEALSSFDERLRTSILGFDGSDPRLPVELRDVPFPDIRARFAPYLGWLECPDVLVLRYEEFITDREVSLGRVFDHAAARGFPSRCGRREAVRLLGESIDPQRSPTFRQGKVGGWREKFTEEHKILFKMTAGDLLLQLGYESGEHW